MKFSTDYMLMLTTPFYAAILALLFFVLSARTINLRRRFFIPIGDGGNEELARAIRAHANFAEYVPITLISILLLEVTGGSFINLFCLSLLAGRISHAYGISHIEEQINYRAFGMMLTLAALVGSSSYSLFRYVWHFLF